MKESNLMTTKEFVSSLNECQKSFLISLFVFETLSGNCEVSSNLIKNLGVDSEALTETAYSGSLKEINDFLKQYGIEKTLPEGKI